MWCRKAGCFGRNLRGDFWKPVPGFTIKTKGVSVRCWIAGFSDFCCGGCRVFPGNVGASSHPMFTKHFTRIYAAAGYDLSLKIFVRHWLWNFDLWNFDSHSEMKITVNRGLVGGDLFYLIPSTRLRLEHIGKHHSPPINISKPTSPKEN